MTVDQKYRCDLIINTDGDDRVFHRNFGGLYSTLISSTSTVITQYYFDSTIPKVYKRDVNISNDTTTETDLEIASWNIIYSDDSISGGNTYPASQVSYDNSGSGLDADNAQDAIDKLTTTPRGYKVIAEFVGDGVKTYSDAILTFIPYIYQADLFIDGSNVFYPRNPEDYFSINISSSGKIIIYAIRFDAENIYWKYITVANGTEVDYTSTVVPSGRRIRLCKKL